MLSRETIEAYRRMTPGERLISSTVMPRLIAIMLMPSIARPLPIAVQW